MSDLKQLKAIEKIISKKLKPCPADENIMDWGATKNSYLLNEFQQVIGLNLAGNQLSDISVLKALPNLTMLNLECNQLKILPECLLAFNPMGCVVKFR